jgi:adenosine kinase
VGRIAVTGSIAFDTIMVFPGRFGDHILPDKTHVINVAFLVERMERRRGGTAANIAYTLALLGETPLLCAAAGADFAAYGDALSAAGVDISGVLECPDVATAGAFITTDLADNQITAFYPGAMARAAAIDLRTLEGISHVVVAPDAPDAMAAHVEQCAEMGAQLAFVPAQQIPALAEAALRQGLERAWLVTGNDYEWEMIRARSGHTALDLAGSGTITAVTLGANGSVLRRGGEEVSVPAATPDAVVDPTGAGDAYVAGLVTALRAGRGLADAGRMAALAAAYVVERSGTQEHAYTQAEFAARHLALFPTSPALARSGSAAADHAVE